MELVIKRLEAIEHKVEPLALLLAENNQLKSKVEALEKSIEKLNDEIISIHISNDIRDQYSRKNNLIISGVKEEENEDLVRMINNLTKVMGVKPCGILAAHRLPVVEPLKKIGIPSDIIIKFEMYETKEILLTKYKEVMKRDKKLTVQSLGLSSSSQIWLKDHLTSKRSYLLRQAKKLVKTNKLAFAWVSRVNIFIKDKENGLAKKVLDIKDLPNFQPTNS